MNKRTKGLVLTLAAGLAACSSRADLPELPRPAVSSFGASVRAQVNEADESARAHPWDANANGRFGMVLHAYGMYEAASLCYRRASQLAWWDSNWTYYLGLCELELGQYDQAAATFRRVTWIRSGSFALRYHLAEALLMAGRVDEAAHAYQGLAGKYSNEPWAHFGLAQALASRGDTAGAVEAYTAACQLFPGFKRARFRLANEYHQAGDQKKADEQLRLSQQAWAVNPPFPDSLLVRVRALESGYMASFNLGLKLVAARKMGEAAAAFERALEIEPAHMLSHINLITAYGALGRWDLTELHYQDAIRLDSNRADAYGAFGAVLLNQGKDRDAESAFRKALELDPTYPEALYGLALLEEKQSRWPDAERHCLLALEATPNYREARQLLNRIRNRSSSPPRREAR